MSANDELLERIDRLSARAAVAGGDPALLSALEDVLAEGYVQALSEEAERRRVTERLELLVEALHEPGAAVEARRLAVQRRTLDVRITTLRERLSIVREHFVRLGGAQSAHR